MATFVFFHVGPEFEWPVRLVESIHAHNPGAEVIQVTDHATRTVPGVTQTFATSGDPRFLMQWRVDAFASLGMDATAVYMDTDMVVRKPLEPTVLLGRADIAMTRRSFNKDSLFNVTQRGQHYPEYAGKTLDEVYPFIGCLTVTPNSGTWGDLAARYRELPDRFKCWYGDQEVLREYAKTHRVAHLAESDYACLPEHLSQRDPYVIHYKGARKRLFPKSPA